MVFGWKAAEFGRQLKPFQRSLDPITIKSFVLSKSY